MGGKKEIMLGHGGIRKFLKDGDEVTMTAVCQVYKRLQFFEIVLKFLLHF